MPSSRQNVLPEGRPQSASSPRLLAAEQRLEAARRNLADLSTLSFAAIDELRQLSPQERPLFTAAAKIAAGGTDYTDAEAKAVIALKGSSAAQFQRLEPPRTPGGPRQLKILTKLPEVTLVGPNLYRLPEGVTIKLPDSVIVGLVQRAPSLANLLQRGVQTISQKTVPAAGQQAPNLAMAEKDEVQLRPMLTRTATLWKKIVFANQRIGPVTVDLNGDVMESSERLNVGAHTAISFQRTLRVPEDGQEYPLPADMGALPIYRIEDFADKVPPHWLEDGGFFIPLYQREALFIAFKGASWRPTAAKVAVGRINAVSGKPYDEQIRPHEQDYIIIPDQQWLDGINTGKGLVSQFVAMPLGEGYTVEEQITDEAKHGGFQIVVFEPHADRFPMENPTETEERRRKAAKNRVMEKQKIFIASLDPHLRPIAYCFQSGENNYFSHPPEAQIFLLSQIRELMVAGLGPEAMAGWEDDKIADFPNRVVHYYDEGRLNSAPSTSLHSAPSEQMGALFSAPARMHKQVEMGISRGGSVKQQIYRDHYGVQSWNETAKRMLNIRIVNSDLFHEITGEDAPESPITMEAYKEQGIPWFDKYDESAESVAPAKRFTAVKGVATIDMLRGKHAPENWLSVAITPELIKRIHTPTRAERIANFLSRAEASWRAKRFHFALRETTLALQFIHKSGGRSEEKFRALYLRASCNNKLERYLEAEADASELLEGNGARSGPLAVRAYSYLRLAEYDLALADSTQAIEADASCLLAREVKAESLLWTDADNEAFAEAGRALEIQPCSGAALLVRGECWRRMGYLEYALADLNLALTFGGTDAVAYATRAEALVALGRIDEAKRDLKLALHLIPHYDFARNLLAQITS
jgi:tetratricopeptide (TPR) repeat protein